MKRVLLAVFSIALIILIVNGVQSNFLVWANFAPAPPTVNIVIRPDGSIEQPTQLFLQNQNTYTLTQDLQGNGTYTYCIQVQKDNINLDGQQHTVSNALFPAIVLNNTQNVIVKNFQITNYATAISLVNSSNNHIYANNLFENVIGVGLNQNSNFYHLLLCGLGISLFSMAK